MMMLMVVVVVMMMAPPFLPYLCNNRDWNEDYQGVRDMVVTNINDRLMKVKTLYKVGYI